ncbi:hypothetical protein TIFTF001_028164 [Ficus carica]|uniref:WAT1-related protein n=1 Tax=Ficus carica TaxID=3494 RepID=A0AA88DPE8_FICCA|nr:hypothetical protein TIFTF001_028164 [Ficus carica]
MGVKQICDAVHGMKPALLMVVVQFAFTGVNIFYKLAANDGMNLRVIIAYRLVFSTAFMLPLAFFMEWYPRNYHLCIVRVLFLSPIRQRWSQKYN